MNDPIPSPVRALLEVFKAELPEVRFPDVDFAVLEATEAEVMKQTEAVAQAEAALADAKKAQLEAFESLMAKSRRALAYAKVFAEDKPELMAKLDAIGLKVPKAIGARPKDEAPKKPEPAAAAEVADGDDAPKKAPPTRELLQKASAAAESDDDAPKKRGRPKKNGHATAEA
ncbi:hypothetical protein L6R52_25765 [Myxococcota bacterium]|nr:hypothetical protein [Myxococcota bacterium]